DRVELRLARAALPGADPIRLADGADKFPPPERSRLLSGLISVGGPASKVLAPRLAELEPGNADVRFLLLRQALADGDEAAARDGLAELRRVESGDGPLSLVGTAALRLRSGTPDGLADARLKLAEAGKRRPGWGLVPLLEAELAERQGRTEDAVECYRRAVDRGERPPGTVRRLVQLLQERHRYDEAREVLRTLS